MSALGSGHKVWGRRGRRGFRGYEKFQTSQGGYERKIHVLRGYEIFLGYDGGGHEIFGCFMPDWHNFTTF